MSWKIRPQLDRNSWFLRRCFDLIARSRSDHMVVNSLADVCSGVPSSMSVL